MIKSIELGNYYANKYKKYSLNELLDKFNLKVNIFDGSNAEKYVLGYYEDEEIYLNQNSIKKLSKMLNLDINNIVIAHELFHHIERLELLKDNYSYNSEMSAQQFTKTFLDLEFNPSIFDEFLKTM